MKITFEFATQDDCLDRMVPSDLRVLVAQRDRLQARVAELAAVAVSVRDVLLLRSEIDSDGTRCVNLSASKWSSFCDVIDDNNSGAFITRKQAEAVQASRQEGEPIGFLQSSGVSQLSGGFHDAVLLGGW